MDGTEQGGYDTTIMVINLTQTTVTLLTPQPHHTNPTSGQSNCQIHSRPALSPHQHRCIMVGNLILNKQIDHIA